MKLQRRIDVKTARSLLESERLVERPAPGAAPTAFRIWAAGDNPTDYGITRFTQRAADTLLAEQEKRGNLYSIDFDHLSLETNRPAEAGRAAGWHRIGVKLDEQGEPELWALDVEWCEDVKEGLESKPPKWRYFSPAYGCDAETNEPVTYLNTAVCINPATWQNTQLAVRATRAAQETTTMKLSEVLGALKALANDESAPEDQRKAAAAAFEAMGGEDALQKALEDDEPPSQRQAAKPEDEEKPEDKKNAKNAKPETPYEASKGKDAAVLNLASRLAKLEAEAAHREVSDLVAANADKFTPALRDWALTQPASVVKGFLASAPKQHTRATTTGGAAQPTQRGAGPSGSSTSGAEEALIDRVMGRGGEPPKALGFQRNSAGVLQLNTATPAQVRARRKD